jgi:hypothetical protein
MYTRLRSRLDDYQVFLFSFSQSSLTLSVDPIGIYTSFPAVIDGNTVIFTLTDNGAGDSNPAVHMSRDPGGLGVAGGVATVPMLPRWVVWLLGALLGIVAVPVLRRT